MIKTITRALIGIRNSFLLVLQTKIKGEFTPTYLRDEDCPKKIYKNFPEAKLIVCFRNPLERLVSVCHFDYTRGKTNLDIESCFKNLSPYKLSKHLYFKNISNFLRFFPKEQILITIYEDIQKDPKAFIQKIYKFLKVEHSFVPPSLAQPENITFADITKIRAVNRFLWKSRAVIKKSTFSFYLIPLIKKSGLHWLVKKIFKWNIRKKSNKEMVKKRLPSKEQMDRVKNFYKDDIKKLEKFIRRDLSHWYQ